MSKQSLSEALFWNQKEKFFYRFSNPIKILGFYKNKKIDLLEMREEIWCWKQTQNYLSKINLNFNEGFQKPRIFLCAYELGEQFFNFNDFDENQILFYEVEFDKIERIEQRRLQKSSISISKSPGKKDYNLAYNKVNSHLLAGDAYQINLTDRFTMNWDKISLHSFEQLSPMAHSICIEEENFLMVSNSPECLFDHRGQTLFTYPIKGTAPFKDSFEKKQSLQWLMRSEKNRVELRIITDLMRNDLSQIGDLYSQVTNDCSVLSLHDLLHLYAQIKVKTNDSTNLYDVLRALFPGGSVTGAPKKRVMEIIRKVEEKPRQFYTGSTILCWKGVTTASLNIRSVFSYKQKTGVYGSGGGITILSEIDEEYEEMISKAKSFI